MGDDGLMTLAARLGFAFGTMAFALLADPGQSLYAGEAENTGQAAKPAVSCPGRPDALGISRVEP